MVLMNCLIFSKAVGSANQKYGEVVFCGYFKNSVFLAFLAQEIFFKKYQLKVHRTKRLESFLLQTNPSKNCISALLEVGVHSFYWFHLLMPGIFYLKLYFQARSCASNKNKGTDGPTA